MTFRIHSLLIFVLVLCSFTLTVQTAQSQDETPVYFSKKVVDADDNPVNNSIPTVLFTAFLNGEQDSILVENAPRWDGGETNYDPSNNLVGVELQNFTHFAVDDTVYLRFTDRELGQRSTYTQKIDTIPWSDPNPFGDIELSAADFPERPQNVSLSVSDSYDRTLTWDAEAGISYHVYRRSRTDTIFDGSSRNLYVRVASGLESGTFEDSNTDSDKRFGYIVYAEDENGNWSVHSEDVFDVKTLQGLQVSSHTARNATISWESFSPDVGKLAGYNVYRRQEGDTWPNKPTHYTGTDTAITDTRLEPGETYYYKVLPRNYELEEMGESPEVSVTTESSTEGYMTYANLKLAIVIYANANSARGGDYQMSEDEIEDIKFLLERMREWFWQNTEMQLNLEYDYIVFRNYKTLEGNRATSVTETGQHMAEDRGVVNTQYDMVFRITPSIGGFYSWGATDLLELPGGDRRTGFSQVRWPYRNFAVGGFDKWPQVYSEIDYNDVGNNLIWTAEHENQHTIDNIYDRNGHPEMGHGDFPQLYATTNIENSSIGCCYPGFPEDYSKKFGRRFSFQGTMMRDFDSYKALNENWGDIYETKDVDGDQMPDNDPRVPMDEQSFGSSTEKADTDNDGYTDKQEAVDGIFEYSQTDPHDPDTDGDGIKDGEDKYPRYKMDTRIKTTAEGFRPQVDGDLSEWPEHAMVVDSVSKVEQNQGFDPKVYMAYNNDSLYVAMDLPTYAEPYIRWDFDADGRWYGSGNLVMDIDVNNNEFDELRTWDGSEEARDLDERINDKTDGVGNGLYDNKTDYLQEFGSPIMTANDVRLSVDNSGSGPKIEFAIPQNDRSNLALEVGEEIGFHIDYTNINTLGIGAKTFDWWSYAYVDLTDLKATSASSEPEIARDFKLEQNYPNPFNPTTSIEFALPKAQDVTLTVYNALGQEVRTLVSEKMKAGSHSVQFDGSGLSSGVYMYRLETGNQSQTRKMLLVK